MSPEPITIIATTTVTSSDASSEKSDPQGWRRYRKILLWTPRGCRYHPDKDFTFSLWLNILFGVASTITVANMYYAYPVLNKIAADFGISYQKASTIPTLLQAGYGCGILFLCPLGDAVRIRPFVLLLILTSTTIWTTICITTDFSAFCGLSFAAGFTAVTPQLMLPLADSLAPPARKVRAVSIVFAGLMFGQVMPRFMSGVVTQYTHWRNVYWVALGLQVLLLALLWLFFPDYKAPSAKESTYLQIMGSMLRLVAMEPFLVYGCLISLLSNSVMSSFWTALTAQLASPYFNFRPLDVGLFSLIAIVPVFAVPIYGSTIIERYATWLSATIALGVGLAGVIVGTFAGDLTIAALVVQALAIDFGVDANSVAYRTAIYSVVPTGRNRANVVYTTCSFVGQLMGTSVGNSLYAAGGWRNLGAAGIAFLASSLVLVYFRGPLETRWVGWKGGFVVRKTWV